ncbi:MAG: DUF2283 domain-containing protein [Vicinamibacteraceae bacterium]
MDAVRVIHDRHGQTLTVWFGDATKEAVTEQTESGVLIMRDASGRVLGVEILSYEGEPTEVSLQLLGQSLATATATR